jgi:hypothetical protein
MKKKTHGRVNARGLTGAELTNKVLTVKERAEQTVALTAKKSKARAVTPEESADKDISLIPDTPPTQQPWESQSGTFIMVSLLIRTPERPRAAPRASSLSFPPSPLIFLSFIAPARLAEGRGARKRRHTERYEAGIATGDLDES